MKKFLFLIFLLLIAGLISAGFYLQLSKAKNEINTSNQPKPVEENVQTPASTPESVDQSLSNPDNVSNDQVVSRPADNPKTSTGSQKDIKTGLVYPMNDFNNRIWLNPFGNQPSKTINKGQYSDYICAQGSSYAGYHNAVDLEVTKPELNAVVPVYSIADGVIRQAGHVNGYGGLIVAEYTINGKIYTVYYGHIDLDSATVKAGSKVTAGQKIADLAPACSAKSGNNRKHLHFGIHIGKNIDVRGYVTNKNELNNWVDPRTLY